MKTTEAKLSSLTQDPTNANKGTQRGQEAIRESLSRYGSGRSILIDKNGVIIAGNKTSENAIAAGMEDAIIVPSDGTKLIVVQRTDLDLTTDKKARELALADNRSAELSLDWDIGILAESLPTLDLAPFWQGEELTLLDGADEPPEDLVEKEVILSPQKFVRALISVPLASALKAKSLLDQLADVEGIEIDYGAN